MVWDVLTDFERYPEWNTFLRKVEGRAAAGERLRMYIVSGRQRMWFRPTVLAADPNRELRWIGHLFVSGLFDGEHSFTLEPLGQQRTRLRQDELFNGMLIPLMGHMLNVDARRSFEEMNAALKQRAEARSTD